MIVKTHTLPNSVTSFMNVPHAKPQKLIPIDTQFLFDFSHSIAFSYHDFFIHFFSH